MPDQTEETGVTGNQKDVIGGLMEATDANGKRVLTSYDPTRSYEANLHNVKKCKTPQLETCGKLLGLTVRSEDGKRKLYKNQDILADRIIMKIESLFEAKCTECDEMYQNTLESTPEFQCRLCMLGSHDCAKMKEMSEKASELNAERPRGVVWLCHGCLEKNDLDNLQPPPEKKQKPDSKKEEEEKGVSQVEKLPDDDEDSTEATEIEEAELPTGAEREKTRASPRRGRSSDGKSVAAKKTSICKNYVKRTCPHGRTGQKVVNGSTCDKSHPKRCFRFCDFGANHPRGCNKGKDCEFWHPRICTASRKNEVCKKSNCTFQHLLHTREAAKETYRREEVPKVRADPTGSIEMPGSKRVVKEDDPSSFLLKLIENLRAGIQEQIEALREEMRKEAPRPKAPGVAATSHPQWWNHPPPWYHQSFPKLSS